MPSERHRILQLALESLESRKKQIEEEIAALNGELHRGRAGRRSPFSVSTAPSGSKVIRKRKRSRFTREERKRRSARMKAFWKKWREDKARKK